MLKWFHTRNGRYFTRGCVGVTAFSVFGVQIAVNGPCIEKYKSVFQFYSKTVPYPLNPDVAAQAQQALNDSGLSENQKSKMTFFNVVSHELFHAGAANFPWGAVVGIPHTFSYKNKEDINLYGMRIFGKEDIEWDSGGQQLADSLILSDSAKKFAIVREIYSCDLKHIFMEALLSTFAIIFPAKIIYERNKKNQVFQKSLSSRLLVYLVCYVFGFAVQKMIKDHYRLQLQKKCDKKAAGLSPEYLDGGLEFYAKTLNKHKALRRIIGQSGSYLYDETGNLNKFLFASHLPITGRIDYLQKLQKSINKE